jgi:hypothetical protein
MTDEVVAEAGAGNNEAGEAQVGGDAAAAAAAAGDDQGKPVEATETQAPESYDFKLPDGIELDADAVTEFSAIAKEMKLDQASAQKLADVAANMVQRQAEQHAATVQGWVDQVKADKEIGGDKMPEHLAIAQKALDTFGSPELREILNSTGLGNNPEVIRAFYRAGKAISEDTFVPGRQGGAVNDPAKTMFPTMN